MEYWNTTEDVRPLVAITKAWKMNKGSSHSCNTVSTVSALNTLR